LSPLARRFWQGLAVEQPGDSVHRHRQGALVPVWMMRFFSAFSCSPESCCSHITFWPRPSGPGPRARKCGIEGKIMLRKADTSATWAVIFALLFFFIGGILPPSYRPMVRQELEPAVRNTPTRQGARRQTRGLHRSRKHGRESTSAKAAGTVTPSRPGRCLPTPRDRAGKGVDSPVSTPDEFVYDYPHMFGTKRTGRIFRAWAGSTTRNGTAPISATRATSSPDPSCRPSVADRDPKESRRSWLICKNLTAKGLASPTTDYERYTCEDYSYPSVYFAYSVFFLILGLSIYFCIKSRKERLLGQKPAKTSNTA